MERITIIVVQLFVIILNDVSVPTAEVTEGIMTFMNCWECWDKVHLPGVNQGA